MEWDHDLCLKLIEEYKSREVLWNLRQANYYNKLKKEEAWLELANSVDKGVEETKKKIESLKGSYRREKARIRRSYLIGKSIYESKWFAYESLQFLEDKDEPLRNSTNPEYVYNENESDPDTDFLCEELYPEVDDVSTDLKALRRKRSKSKLLKLITAASRQKKDPCSIFGDLIGAKLRMLDRQTQATAEHRILNVLYELEIANFNE